MNPWTTRIDSETGARVWREAVRQSCVSAQTPAVVFHDLELMGARIESLCAAFPDSALHAIAIKANPLVEVLRAAVTAGAGLEAASMEEVHVALAAGCRPERIVFDSPAKSRGELREALELGVMLNIDNFDEFDRFAELTRHNLPKNTVGLRVNPVVGGGRIAATSVAVRGSKFGVDIELSREQIVAAFSDNPWLTALHVHVGSQGCSLELLVEAARRIDALREEIHRRIGRVQIDTIDIGGGLPADYGMGGEPPTMQQYAERLRAAVPGLFEPGVRLITEFGRAVQAGCGFAVSRVEYVKHAGDQDVAVIHLGADFLMRPAYLPDLWRHRFSTLESSGHIKRGGERPCSIAGPLCFAGDIVGHDVPLPPLEEDDLVVIHDVGAYTLSMWSRHCSRGMPLVLGYRGREVPEFQVLRQRETPADVVRFWSGPAGSVTSVSAMVA